MTWNQLDKIQSPAIVTTDFVYLRLIGDRSIKDENVRSYFITAYEF